MSQTSMYSCVLTMVTQALDLSPFMRSLMVTLSVVNSLCLGKSYEYVSKSMAWALKKILSMIKTDIIIIARNK